MAHSTNVPVHFNVLFKAFLCNQPHRAIIYPRKSVHLFQSNLEFHFSSRKVEYLKQYNSFTAMCSDADLVRELRKIRSTTSVGLLTNGVATHVQNYLSYIKDSSK
eukprot:5427150-Ditylum_brightwellii.AAC.1